MNALQGMDRYRKEVIQVSAYKERHKGSESLRVFSVVDESYTSQQK